MSRFEFARKVLRYQESRIFYLTRGMPEPTADEYLTDIRRALAELDAADAEVKTWTGRAEGARELETELRTDLRNLAGELHVMAGDTEIPYERRRGIEFAERQIQVLLKYHLCAE